MKVIDDHSKKLHWWNRNYFFVVTILVAAINIILYVYDPWSQWRMKLGGHHSWDAVLSFENLLCQFLSAFCHSNWQHVLLNMLCFVICGGWLERRKGSLGMLFLVPAMAMIAEAFVGANDLSLGSVGFSGANYALYAYAILDYIFLFFRRETRTLGNVISGAVLMGLIYFAMTFSGGTSEVTFEWYPYDFMHNMGHYSAFLGGAIVGLMVQAAKLGALREQK